MLVNAMHYSQKGGRSGSWKLNLKSVNDEKWWLVEGSKLKADMQKFSSSGPILKWEKHDVFCVALKFEAFWW